MMIEIETADRRLLCDMMGTSNPPMSGTAVDIPGNATVILKGARNNTPPDIPVKLELSVALGSGASSRLMAVWLHGKTAGRVSKIRIDGVEIGLSRRAIEKVMKARVRLVCP